MQIHWRFVKNAVANLATRKRRSRGRTVAATHLLVRHMTATSYAVWVLVLQDCSLCELLEFRTPDRDWSGM